MTKNMVASIAISVLALVAGIVGLKVYNAENNLSALQNKEKQTAAELKTTCQDTKVSIGTAFYKAAVLDPNGAQYNEAAKTALSEAHRWFNICEGYYDPAKIAEMKQMTAEVEATVYVVS